MQVVRVRRVDPEAARRGEARDEHRGRARPPGGDGRAAREALRADEVEVRSGGVEGEPELRDGADAPMRLVLNPGPWQITGQRID